MIPVTSANSSLEGPGFQLRMASRRPNVILVVADDMGYGDFGCFSDGTVRTPHLDRLVDEGTCFRQHYSASPICAPARAALLTGRYPHRTGAITQHEIHGLDRIALREVTLADAFRSAGYATSLVGKWHNGTFDRRFEPNARGFDEFTGFCGGWPISPSSPLLLPMPRMHSRVVIWVGETGLNCRRFSCSRSTR